MLKTWSPFREMDALQRQMNLLLNEVPGRPMGFAETRYPMMDVSQNEDEVRVRALLPGLRRDEVDISIRQGVLSIRGTKKEAELPEDARAVRVERRHGSFQRTIRLNTKIDEDKVEATLRDGVLTVRLPRVPEAKPKRIELASA